MTRATFSKSLPCFTFEMIYGALLIPFALCLWTEAARSQDFNPTGCWDYSIIQKNVLNQVPLGGSSQLVMWKAIIKKCLPSCAAQGETSSMSSHWVKKNFLVPGAEVSSLLVPRNYLSIHCHLFLGGTVMSLALTLQTSKLPAEVKMNDIIKIGTCCWTNIKVLGYLLY